VAGTISMDGIAKSADAVKAVSHMVVRGIDPSTYDLKEEKKR
jgi:hypothetical protein